MNEILKTMNRSISNQDYADLFNDGLPWRENNYKIDFSQFLSIMKRLEIQTKGTASEWTPCTSRFQTSDSISRNEMRVIFGHFDIDNDGEISFEGNFNYILYLQCLILLLLIYTVSSNNILLFIYLSFRFKKSDDLIG